MSGPVSGKALKKVNAHDHPLKKIRLFVIAPQFGLRSKFSYTYTFGVVDKERPPVTGGRRCCDSRRYFRAGDRVRTGDIQLGKLALYQLSYARNGTTNNRRPDPLVKADRSDPALS